MKSFDTDKFIKNVFLHGKNADERLFDLILRSITFIVILFFVVFFSTVKVHADDTQYLDIMLLGDNTLDLQPYFNNTDWATVKSQYPDTPYNTSIFGFVSEVPGHVVLTSDMDIDNCFCALGRCYWSGSSDSANALFIDKDLAISNHVTLLYDGYIYSDSDVSAYVVWFNKRQSLNTSLYTIYNITIPSGITEFRNIQPLLYGSTFYWYLSNLPMLNTHDSTAVSNWLSNGDNTESVFNVNYIQYNDLGLSPDMGEQESNLNHLYFKDVQIALSGSTDKTSLESASAVIGVDVDNWVKNNIDDFTMDVTYQWIGKYRGLSDFQYTSSYSHPCATFLNDIYSFSLAQSMIDSGFYDHAYTHMKDNYDFRSTDAVMNALKSFSGKLSWIKTLSIEGGYIYYGSEGEGGNDNQTSILDYFYLDVSVTIHADNVSSGVFTKRFDFLRGTESIMNSDGLRNNNPWLGEVDPNNPNNVDPYQNSNGSSGSGGGATANATVGDINISTGNGYQDTELHQLTEMDIQRNHIKIIETINTLRDAFDRLASENEDNGFVGMIRAEYDYIPGVDYILDAIVIVCAICIIAFFIRIVF